MGTTADKLQHLADTKELIKTAIQGKGQSFSGVETFRDYATKIGNISTECTAVASNILSGKTAYSGGSKITGTVASKGAQTYSPSTSPQTITAGQYLSGTQTISAITGTAGVGDVLSGKTFASGNGVGITGTMPSFNYYGVSGTTQGQNYFLPNGYHSNGYVNVNIPNLVAENVKSGVNVGGVVGTLEGVKQRTVNITNLYGAYNVKRCCMFGGNSKLFDFSNAPLSNVPSVVNTYGDLLVTHTVTYDNYSDDYYYFFLYNGLGGTELARILALNGSYYYIIQVFALNSNPITMGVNRN